MVYCLATVLDPRYKLDGLFKLLDAYHANMKIPVQDRKSEIKTRFVRFYEAYDAYFQQYRSQTVRAKHLALQSEGCSSFGTGTKSAVRIARIARTSGGTALHAELNYYLSSDDVSSFDNIIEGGLEMLDVLEWWKSIGIGRYPVLATMARDLLAPVASGKVPEGTFRFYAPGINEMRREFEARMAEMVVCYKDWIVAEERKQHLFVNECEDEDDD
ncbi:Zinc finger BED domain-containing protein DAYSLEEPER [Linum perenne]